MPSLPPLSWLTLPEVISWLVERGISESDARSILPRAFRDGEIQTRGRARLPTGIDKQIELEEFSWEQATVNWEESWISIPSSDGPTDFGTKIEHVNVSRADLHSWLDGNETDDASRRKTDEPTGQSSGRKRKTTYDWESFYVEIAVLADLDALPQTQAGLERQMADWCRDNWGTEPSESMLRSKISPIYNHPRKSQGQ